jgi:tetratricopeptide (TPR) repeat protein
MVRVYTARSIRDLLFLAAFLTGPAGRAQLVRDWHALRSPHFEFISRYDPTKIRPLVLELEWARSLFETNFGLKSGLDRPVLVFLPDSPFEYEQINPSKYSGGYYFGAPWRDLIVLRELLRVRHGLLHEYTHLVTHHQGARFPAWLTEGIAEFYATARRTKEGAEAGLPEPDQIALVRKGAWVPIAYLASLDSSSTLDSRDAMARFYAQSWLYTHMLHLAPAYREQVPQFRTLVADGVSTEEALRRLYSKSLIQFDNDAREWFRQERFPTLRLQAPAEPSADVEDKIIGDLDVEIARATIAAAGPNKSDAGSDYARLAKMAGERCDLQAALGELAHAAGFFRESSNHYQQGLRCGIKAAELAQGLAESLSHRTDVRPEELERVTVIGGGGRTHYLIGAGRFFSKDYEGALRNFEKASGLPQPEEFRMTRMKAIALAGLGRYADAQEAAERLKSMARDADQRQAAELTLEDVRRDRERAETPPDPHRTRNALLSMFTRLEGEVLRVDCMGERVRFWIRSGSETKKLLIADPGEVVTGPEAAPLEFGCGPQRRPVVIGYEEQRDAATDTIGRIRYIEFR